MLKKMMEIGNVKNYSGKCGKLMEILFYFSFNN